MSRLLVVLFLATACSRVEREEGRGGNGGDSAILAATSTVGTNSSARASTGAQTTSASSSASSGIVPGGPGCGFAEAAFCDTFDAPAAQPGRAGELDPIHWSASRGSAYLPTEGGDAFPVRLSTMPACRPDLPRRVPVDRDTVVCDPTAHVQSPHLLVSAASQNYGITSLRTRRPFDFSGRVGTIAFDAEAIGSQLLGWLAISITEDPVTAPSFAIHPNQEGNVVPRSALELQFDAGCGGTGTARPRSLHLFRDHVDTMVPFEDTPDVCEAVLDRLSHFEIRVSETRVEVWMSPPSDDGVDFAPVALVAAADVEVGFSRGYVHLQLHNHATILYSPGQCGGGLCTCASDADCAALGDAYRCTSWLGEPLACVLDAWTMRVDNFGFDGPVVPGGTEVEVPNASTPSSTLEGHNVGWIVPDESAGEGLRLHFAAVGVAQHTTARLAFTAFYPTFEGDPSTYALGFRINGGPLHVQLLTDAEQRLFTEGAVTHGADGMGGTSTSEIQGILGQVVTLPIEELVEGDNVIEVVARNVPRSYPPAIANVDLILSP